MTEVIGYLAGILVASSSIPQIIKSWRTKSTKDLSYGLMSLNLVGQILWIVYAYLTKSYPLGLTGLVILIFAFSLLVLKIRYK